MNKNEIETKNEEVVESIVKVKDEIKFSEMLSIVETVIEHVVYEDELGNTEYRPENIDLYFRYWLVKFYTDYPIDELCTIDNEIDTNMLYDLLWSDEFNYNILTFALLNDQQKYIYELINKKIENKLQMLHTQRYSLTDRALSELLNKVPTLLEKMSSQTDGVDLKKLTETMNKLGTKASMEKVVKAMIDSGAIERPVKKEEVKD